MKIGFFVSVERNFIMCLSCVNTKHGSQSTKVFALCLVGYDYELLGWWKGFLSRCLLPTFRSGKVRIKSKMSFKKCFRMAHKRVRERENKIFRMWRYSLSILTWILFLSSVVHFTTLFTHILYVKLFNISIWGSSWSIVKVAVYFFHLHNFIS